VKWVKAHDDTHASPYNELADRWSSYSIRSGNPFTSTLPLQAQDITNATRPVEWHTSETPPRNNAAKITALKTIANAAILLTEDARYRKALQHYIHPHHINFPGTGSTIVQAATVPHAHWLLHLRRDTTQHFADHPKLNGLNTPCPCCTSNLLSTHSHLLQHCTMDQLSPRDKKKFLKARRFILSLHSPPLPH
jgi:hypothetical protein